ncbi:MAG: hypothetical protein M1270_06130, partial [Gammaproteobacteria bacterium]|nr:hypothetical protein [Gammaproteobacteria bacterium]
FPYTTLFRSTNSDYEWYPTTTPMLECIKKDIDQMVKEIVLEDSPSILDCGAGDGLVVDFVASFLTPKSVILEVRNIS